MLIRPCQYIHTSLLIYSYGPGKIFIRPCHTDQLDYLITVLRTGCFCIGSGANTAKLESMPGPIQKQPVNTIIFTDTKACNCLITYTIRLITSPGEYHIQLMNTIIY